MERSFVPYPTFTRLCGLVPIFFVAQGEGGYDLFAVGADLFIASRALGDDAIDFDAKYKASSQEAASGDDALVLGYAGRIKSPVVAHQADGAQLVALVGREGDEYNKATHNFCDRTTWYSTSERITGEQLVDSGDGLTWNSASPWWVDLDHGKVMREDEVRAEVDHGYEVVVRVDGTVKTMRRPFATSGGDYTVDHATGRITFAASQAGRVVTADYSRTVDSVWILAAPAGKIVDIESCEIQFSTDFEMTGAIVMAYYASADAIAPGTFPPGTIIPIPGARHRYETHAQVIDEALGAYPVIPASGGAARGTSTAMYGYPFRYGSVGRLLSSAGMQLRCWIEDADGNPVTPYGGTRATATFYTMTRDEKTIE